MSDQDELRAACERIVNIPTPHDAFRAILALASRQRAAAFEEAEDLAIEEGKSAHLVNDRWDKGYRQAAQNIANIFRERRAAELEAGKEGKS